MKISEYDEQSFLRLMELKRKRTALAEEANSELASSEKVRDFEKIDKEIHEIEVRSGGTPEISEVIKPDPATSQFTGNLGNMATMPNGRSYRDMFHGGDKNNSLNRGGFEGFEDFLQVLSSGRHDPRLREVSIRAMTEGVPSEGGFLVPDEFGAFLLDASLESEIVRSRAKVWPMTSQTRKVPAWDGFDHTSNVFGGFSGVWLAEAGTATRQKAKLRQIQLKAEKLAIYTQASRELIEDGVSYEAQLSDALTSAIGWYLDYAFFQGNGAGQPLGILNDPALITVSKETGQAASTVVYENIINMLARLHPNAFKNAIFIANQTALPQFMTMTLAVGTGGTAIKAVEERGGQFTLIGKPLVFTEKIPTLGSKGDIILADLSKYTIGLRREVVMDKSNAPGWLEDLQDYRVILRADGQGTWSSAVTPKNGDSLSWCVTLQAR